MVLDNLDKRILYELDVDARQSSKKIAKKLHTSKDVVNYRIRQLERRGIIKGYYTLFDFSKIGYMLLRVYLRLKNVSLQKEKEITDFLVKDPNTLWVAKTEVAWDMALGYVVKSFEDFDKAWGHFESLYKPNILEKNVSVIYEFIHYKKSYLGGEKKLRSVVGLSEKIQLDDTDFSIMNILASNARESLVNIARRLSMSPTNAKYRIRKLENLGAILGYRVQINLQKIGVQYYKIDIEIENLENISEIQKFISSHPNVAYEDKTIGGSNIEFDVEVEGHDKFLEIVEDIRKILGKNIRYIRYYIAKDIVKILYFPKEAIS